MVLRGQDNVQVFLGDVTDEILSDVPPPAAAFG
jgi:hypothetical protein